MKDEILENRMSINQQVKAAEFFGAPQLFRQETLHDLVGRRRGNGESGYHTHYLEALRQLVFLSLPAIMQIVKADRSYRNIYLFIPNFLLIILEKMKLLR